jgi:hypothetical protein
VVNGCQTTQPHEDDPIVKTLLTFTSHPQVYLSLVKDALKELRESIVDDHGKGRSLSWLSRIRLIQELYFRSLYLLFVVSPEEVPHVLSGDYPNSFSKIYSRVNDEILLGQGILQKRFGDKVLGEVVPMKFLNIGAHASYTLLLALDSEGEDRTDVNDYLEKYLDEYLNNIHVIGKLFVTGADKKTIKAKAIELHSGQ